MDRINLEKFQVNEETRQITFSCASPTPYQRYDQEHNIAYNEILIVNESAVDLSRLNNSAPLLFNHDTDKLLGMVEKAWIVQDRVYVRVRFSKNDDFADRIYKDILDGLIKNVSIGYLVQEYEDKKENGVNNRYVQKWMIYETSIVSIAADDKVGIRSLKIKDNIKMNCEQQEEKQLIQEQIEKEVVEQIVEQKIENEQPKEQQIIEQVIDQQVDQIQKLKLENEALKLENEKLQHLLAEQPKEQIIEQTVEQQIDEQTKEEIEKMGEDFNIPKEQIKSAIDKKLSVKEFKQVIKQKSFNIKSKEDKKMKNEFRDFLSARNFDKPFIMRDFTGFADTALVGTETTPLVAALDKRLGVKGYRALNGLRSNISIPVQRTRLTVDEVGICADSTDSNPQFEAVELTPHKITGSVLICKEMLANTNSDVEAFIIDSLLKEITYKTQALMLSKVAEGAGREINYSAITAITWSDILAMEAAIDGYLVDNTAFVMSPSARAALKATPKAENTIAGFICQGNQVNGYAVNVSGVVDNDNIYYGDWNQLVLATWGQGIQILVDPYSEARSGNIVIVASALVDSAVVQKNAFALGRVQESSSDSSSSESSL